MEVRQTKGLNDPSSVLLGLLADPFNTKIQSDAVIVSLATSVGMTIVITLSFCFLRPYNAYVYAPRLKHAGAWKAPPALQRGFFAWLKPIVTSHENDYLEIVGPDAAVFIRFASMCRNIFVTLTIFGCAIILPINILAGKDLYSNFDGVPILAKITPLYVVGEAAWAYVVCAYIFDAIVAIFLWANYKDVVQLRRKYFESKYYQDSQHARTVLITGIPEDRKDTDSIVSIVSTLYDPPHIVDAHIGYDIKELLDLRKQYERTVKEFESCLAKCLTNIMKPAAQSLSSLNQSDDGVDKSKGLNAIRCHYNRLEDLGLRISKAKASIDEQNTMPFGFVTLRGIDDAHRVARAASKKRQKGYEVQLAPRPNDLLWDNLTLTKAAQRRKAVIGNFWGLLLTIIWIVPNIFIAVFLSNLTNLGNIWPGFQTQLYKNPNFWAVFQGIAAPAILSLVYFYLPSIFRRLSIHAGDLSRTDRDCHVLSKLYNFFIFNNLIVFSLFSATWAFAAAVIAAGKSDKSASDALREGRLLEKVLQALCNGSSFWVMWLLQRNLGAAVDLSQIWNLIWTYFGRRLMNPTPRQTCEWAAPPPFDYASYYNYFLFYATVTLCYSVLQPLVLPVAALYFFVDTWLKKYLLFYVFSTKNESGGQIWQLLFNRLWFALFLSNIVVLVVVAAQGYNSAMLFAMTPLLLLFGGFKIYCVRNFDDRIQFYHRSKATEVEDLDNSANMQGLMADSTTRYCHPAISKPLPRPIIFSTWVERVETIMHALQSSTEGKEFVKNSDNQTSDKTRSSSETPRGCFHLDFDICEAKRGQHLQDVLAAGSELHCNATHDDTTTHIHLANLRCSSPMLDKSGAERTIYDADSNETTYPVGYRKAPITNKMCSPYKDLSAELAQQSHRDGINQHELLLPNASPMGRAYSDISIPGNAREDETGYF